MKLVKWFHSRFPNIKNKIKVIGLLKYPNSSIKFRLLFFLIDNFLNLLVSSKIHENLFPKPRSILIVNGAHLGDILLSTCFLPLLKKKFPDIQIGFLVGSWAVKAIKDNHLVNRIHTVDHFRLNRSNKNIFIKIWHYALTSKKTLTELSYYNYDIAVNLYSKPNVIALLWLARIPTRIGYINGGLGPLLTHQVIWKNSNNHITDYHMRLLSIIDPLFEKTSNLNYMIPLPKPEELAAVRRISKGKIYCGSKYTVIHVGTGEKKREWPREKWKELAIRLSQRGVNQLIFTGHGQREIDITSWISEGLTNFTDLCGQLDWNEFIAVISGATIVYCVESVAGHVASGLGIPCVAIYSGLNKPNYFKPIGQLTQTITANLDCLGCQTGCADMLCVTSVNVDDILSLK